ncbi:MAG: AraC family transcriptional regulator [Brachymonas sp.]
MQGIPRFIRSATLYGYAELAESAGLNVRLMLQRSGIAQSSLLAPDQWITAEAALDLLERSAQASGWDDFGLRLAARRRLANLGQVSLVLREEPTGLAAVQTLSRYLQLVNPSLYTEVDVAGDVVIIREMLLLNTDQPMRQSMEMAVGVMHGTLRELLGESWRARRVCFTHRAPKSSAFARRLLDCPVEYNAEFCGLVCDLSSLTQELPGRDAAWAQYSRQQLDLALGQIAPSASDLVRQLISALLPQGRCTADQVALQMRVDRRTVARRLAQEDTSFSALLDDMRRHWVLRQLRDSDRSVTEIAQLLGFQSVSAFGHWFALHFGMSARQWRALQTMPAPPQ